MSGEVFQRDVATGLGLFRLGVAHDPIGSQRLAILRHFTLERLRNRLSFGQQFVEAQRLGEHEPLPRPMQRGVGTLAQLVVVPLVICQAQPPGMIRIMGIKSLRKDLGQHRQTQERARVRHELQPFVVVASDGYRHYPLLIFSGTRNVTETGNILG